MKKITELKGQALKRATKEAMQELNEAFQFNIKTAIDAREMAREYDLWFTEDGELTCPEA